MPEWRGKGLQRRLMRAVLDHADGEVLLLFSNDTVLDFYPRFGFEREDVHGMEREIAPASGYLRRLSIDALDDLALLSRVCARSAPVTERLGARG